MKKPHIVNYVTKLLLVLTVAVISFTLGFKWYGDKKFATKLTCKDGRHSMEFFLEVDYRGPDPKINIHSPKPITCTAASAVEKTKTDGTK